MATQYTPEEIAEIFEAYNNAIKTNTPISAELAKQMKDATAGVKNYTDQLNASLKKLGSSVGGFVGAMKDGKQGAAAYNDSINAFADAIESFLSRFPIFGKVLGTMVVAGARYAAEVNKQSDALFDAYKNLSSSGLSDAGGMRTIFDNMQKFGYGIEQLGDMTALLKANSKELASFGGTAASGTRAFADAAAEIQRNPIGKSLQMLGKTPDDINKGIAGFVKQQQGIGVSSANIQKDLAQRSAEYVKQLDLMSKLTGENNETLQAKLEDAQAEDAFAATQFELQKKALAGDQQAAAQLRKNEELAQRLDGEARKEFIRGAGGDISAFSKLLLTAPGAVQAFLDPLQTADQALTIFGKEVKQNMNQVSGLAMLNASNDAFLGFNEMSKAASRYADQTAEEQKERAKAEQELQKKGLEPGTKAQVEMRIEQMKTRDSLQSLINKGINPVTDAMKILSGAAESAAKALPGTSTSTNTQMGGSGGPTPGFWSNLNPFSRKTDAGDVNQILQTIKNRESSGGNYTAQNPYSSASGAYQFIDSTWQSLTKKYGMGGEFKSAKMAPKEIQDAIAKRYVEDILKQAGGDVSKVPLAWYTGNIRGDLGGANIAPGHPGVAEYQAKWMKDYNKTGAGSPNKISGPTGGYDNKLSQVKPAETLPAQQQQANTGPGNAMSNNTDEVMSMLNTHLANIDRRMSDVADNTKKSADYAPQ
jgi:hypothetical protein